jgi:hypothetical protein
MINIFLLQTSSSLKLVHLNMYRISDINEMTTGWIVSDYWKIKTYFYTLGFQLSGLTSTRTTLVVDID